MQDFFHQQYYNSEVSWFNYLSHLSEDTDFMNWSLRDDTIFLFGHEFCFGGLKLFPTSHIFLPSKKQHIVFGKSFPKIVLRLRSLIKKSPKKSLHFFWGFQMMHWFPVLFPGVFYKSGWKGIFKPPYIQMHLLQVSKYYRMHLFVAPKIVWALRASYIFQV